MSVRLLQNGDRLLSEAGDGRLLEGTPVAPGPSVSSLSPSSTTTAGGTSIVIAGSGFTAAVSVQFGSVPATSFVIDNDAQITAVTPAHAAGTFHVVVS